MPQPLLIKNARVWRNLAPPSGQPEARELVVSDRVLDTAPPGAIPVDLDGYTIFPGFINAHDHLELNHFPRTKFRERFDNAHQWGEDVSARLNDAPFRELRAYPLEDRLFIGGLKNLFCGATTVAHHNPPHRALFHADFPVRVLKQYGWAHSLHFSAEQEIRDSYAKTPPDVPWFIHLAEGTDEVAAGEYRRLKASGCVGSNTVLIHGVGLTDADVADAAPRIRGLVWCPSTNIDLLGATADSIRWANAGGRLALGSDSRLTADGDLLDEMRRSADATGFARQSRMILKMVTTNAAEILGVPDAGHLQPGAHADFVVIRSSEGDVCALCQSRRADLALVVKGGVPQLGDPAVMAKFRHIPTVTAVLDGVPKAIHRDLARRLLRCRLRERGLEMDEDALATGHVPSLRRLFPRGVG